MGIIRTSEGNVWQINKKAQNIRTIQIIKIIQVNWGTKPLCSQLQVILRAMPYKECRHVYFMEIKKFAC
jgi:hypothetical protein